MVRREKLKKAKRIVIKVGTSTLTHDTGKINLTRMDRLARAVSDLMNQGKEVVLVSSGAIGVGMGKLKLKHKPKTMPEKQATAAVGQCELMHLYSKLFGEYGHIVAQILLTRDVVDHEIRRTNVVNTFENLLKNGIVPIVNENDTVSVEEIEKMISFGENDTLSAIVAELVEADALIILSDIDGLYDCDPRENECSKLISIVEEITDEIAGFAGGAGTNRGTGGMATKLSAAQIALDAGTDMIIANGKEPMVVLEIMEGKDIGTLFVAKKKSAR